MTVHPSLPFFFCSILFVSSSQEEAGSEAVSQTPKCLDFTGSHRHSMAGTSGEHRGERRGTKREDQRDILE